MATGDHTPEAPPVGPGGAPTATGRNGVTQPARGCDPSTGQTLVVSCAATGKTCQIDACADGAYCCDSGASVDMAEPATMNAECDALGYAGACESGHARWCSGGQVIDLDCGA